MPNDLNTNERSGGDAEHVAVIHGLGSHRWLMLPLVWRLQRAGFAVNNFGYPSFRKSIPEHAEEFGETLQAWLRQRPVARWHIVAHSMGSIITRELLRQRRLERLQRVVMLAPPNAGSPAATRLSHLLPGCRTVAQISDRPGSFVRQLESPSDVELGIVEASYDWVIPKDSVQLPTQRDHVRVFSGHNGLLVRPAAAKETIAFLRRGRFGAEDSATPMARDAPAGG